MRNLVSFPLPMVLAAFAISGLKPTGPLRQVKLRGLTKVDWLFVFSCAAHNLLRLPRLLAQPEPAGLRLRCAGTPSAAIGIVYR